MEEPRLRGVVDGSRPDDGALGDGIERVDRGAHGVHVITRGAGDDQPGVAVVGGDGTERPHQRRHVLASFERAEGEHERPAVERRGPRVRWPRRCGSGEGERTQVDDLDALGPEDVAHPRRGGVARRVDRRPGLDPPPEHVAGAAHRRCRLLGVGQEPAVVDGHHGGESGRRHDVVGAVHDLGVAEPTIEARPVDA